MAATIATMAMLNAKCLSTKTPAVPNQSKPTLKPISLLSLQNLPKGLSISKLNNNSNPSSLLGTALAGAIFSSLSCCESAMAVQQIADLAADGDNRGLALLIPIVPAILWVLYNILQPALNQLNKMRSSNGVIVGLGLGLGAWAASSSSASAGEVAAIAEASSNDSRGLLLLFVITPAVLWVLYNILQPALNQLNRMRSQ
ncbi:photosystem II reaction center proteins PsbY, chloroplastic-like [Aristolochia californica]|uniref:photosystem II reaction center proteins PsbY, chloroplastic-like n=1 Tax=Aristolochia californica TaxID=171875 RepID=UPI0035DF63BA